MHLESITIKNYRKFRTTDNKICFVEPEKIDNNIGENPQKSVIAPSTTLIIGKNNSGKTTVVNALNMACNQKQAVASDFNLSYLYDLFDKYKNDFENNKTTTFDGLETPNLEFLLKIKVNFDDEDLMTHLAPFIPISEKGNGELVNVCITVKVTLTEELNFKEEVAKFFNNTDSESNKLENSQQFEKFYALLSKESSVIKTEGNLYQISFIDILGDKTEGFSLKKLIVIKEIKANRHLKEGVLSNVFSKIVSFQFTNDTDSRTDLEKTIGLMNEQISNNVSSKSNNIAQVLGELESSNKVGLNLSGNVTYDAIMKGLIKYNFLDGDDYIPEDQFGLGYINLLNIIGEIIHFVDSYEDKSYLSRINLLFIEEPEAFMHPQMQEFFIKRIDYAVQKALEIANKPSQNKKTLQCQIAISTHSSHIVNSKVHSSNSFNNINYLTSIKKSAKAINLTDEDIVSNTVENASQKLNFIKKHIKYKVSELFFSDAVIFVEGITEETLLNYYLDRHSILSEYYISVFNINGAHGNLYLPLVKRLSVPCLIVTDLDIKRAKCEKNEKHKVSETCEVCNQQAKEEGSSCVLGSESDYAQITSLNGRTTTNETLKKFNHQLRDKPQNERDKLDDIEFFEDDNLCVVFQKDPIEKQHATSLEEALILTNYKNDIINKVIKACKPNVYQSLVKDESDDSRKSLVHNSFKLQKKLSNSKSEFSNKLLFTLLSEENDENIPNLPNYLEDGLNWLGTKLQTNDTSPLSIAEEVNIDSSEAVDLEVTIDDAE